MQRFERHQSDYASLIYYVTEYNLTYFNFRYMVNVGWYLKWKLTQINFDMRIIMFAIVSSNRWLSLPLITQYLTQSHYPNTEATSLCLILKCRVSDMVATSSDKFKCCKSMLWLSPNSNPLPSAHEAGALTLGSKLSFVQTSVGLGKRRLQKLKDSPNTYSRNEEQPFIKSGETSFSMEQEVESLVPVSNDWLY